MPICHPLRSGWAQALVLWNFILSCALLAQKYVVLWGLGGLLPGEEVATRESFVSIAWRLVPYWMNQVGAACGRCCCLRQAGGVQVDVDVQASCWAAEASAVYAAALASRRCRPAQRCTLSHPCSGSSSGVQSAAACSLSCPTSRWSCLWCCHAFKWVASREGQPACSPRPPLSAFLDVCRVHTALHQAVQGTVLACCQT